MGLLQEVKVSMYAIILLWTSCHVPGDSLPSDEYTSVDDGVINNPLDSKYQLVFKCSIGDRTIIHQ